MNAADITNLVEHLWAAMMDAGEEAQAKLLKKNIDAPIPELIDVLSRLEREVTDMKVHRAIALLKAVIGGTRREADFVRQCLEIQGLL